MYSFWYFRASDMAPTWAEPGLLTDCHGLVPHQIPSNQKDSVKRDQFFKKWILQPNDINRERYVKKRNRVTKVIRNAKRDDNEKVLGENPNAKKFFWVIEIAQKRNQNQPANLESAQVLNEHFTEIGPSLSAKIKSQDLLDKKVERNINSMVINPTVKKSLN